ncbi:scavenger receptor class B member 1-like [Arctopsyche grandis]|uniref:scavenger receptor class B member 1-like n=1 Tax=Arctopsyche grandis TaxID=121162 RepID=UPI00406D8521
MDVSTRGKRDNSLNIGSESDASSSFGDVQDTTAEVSDSPLKTIVLNSQFKSKLNDPEVLMSNIINGHFHKFHIDDDYVANEKKIKDEHTGKNDFCDTKKITASNNEKAAELKIKDSNDNEESPMLGNNKVFGILPEKHYEMKEKSSCCSCCGSYVKLCFGIIFFSIGILTLIYTPFDFLMRERLRMLPGLPAYEWWLKPPDNVFFKIHIFNVTNSERFLMKLDSKLNFNEVGPIVYKEILEHTNVVFNDGDTMTYTANRSLKFVPEYNTHIDLNATLYFPNLAVLGIASYLYDSNTFVKFSFQMLQNSKSKVILNDTIYNYLWNLTDPIVKTVNNIAPGIVPISNIGVLNTMYYNFVDNVTVYIGPKWGDQKFFTVDKFNGKSTLPGFNSKTCNDTLKDSTEGLIYSQRLTKQSKLLYWRKSLCKVVTLNFKEEVDYNGVLAYKFTLPNETYHRCSTPEHADCYAGTPLLHNGLSDISKCFFDLPMAMSLPHFYATDPRAIENITGMEPNFLKHTSYVIVEPLTGTPLESCARSQSNLVMRKMSGFSSDIQLFSGMTLPMFWAEYSALKLPDYIWNLVFITVKVIPVVQVVLSSLILLVGMLLLLLAFKAIVCTEFKSFHHQQQLDNFARKTILGQEKESIYTTATR